MGKAKERNSRHGGLSAGTASPLPTFLPPLAAGGPGNTHSQWDRDPGRTRGPAPTTRRGLWRPRVLAPDLKPSCRQATSVLRAVQPSSQTLPHCPPWCTSRRPSRLSCPPARRRTPSAAGGRHRNEASQSPKGANPRFPSTGTVALLRALSLSPGFLLNWPQRPEVPGPG